MDPTYYKNLVYFQEYRMSVGEMDIVIVINLDDVLVETNHQIWRDKYYYDSDPIDWDIFKKTCAFELSTTEENFIRLGEVKSKKKSMELDPIILKKFYKEYNLNGQRMMSYIPHNLRIENSDLMKGNNRTSTTKDVEGMKKERETLSRYFSLKEKVKEMNRYKDQKNQSEVTSEMTTLTEKQNLSTSEFVTYQNNRHELCCMICMNSIDECTQNNSDESFLKMFEGHKIDWGKLDPMKTPDLHWWETDAEGMVIHIVELAVTDGNAGMRLIAKRNKYSPLVAKVLSETSLRVTLTTAVWKVGDDWHMSGEPSVMERIKKIDMTDYKALENKITSISNYKAVSLAAVALESSGFSDIDETKRAMLEYFNLCRSQNLPRKAISMLNSVDPEKIGNNMLCMESMETDTVEEYANWRAKEIKKVESTSEFMMIDKMRGKIERDELSDEIEALRDFNLEKFKIKMEALKKSSELIYKRSTKKSKMFKFAYLNKSFRGTNWDSHLGNMRMFLDDGTYLFYNKYEKFDIVEPNREGWGMNKVDLEDMMESVRELVHLENPGKDLIENFKRTKMYETMELYETMARECMLMSERRFLINNQKLSAFKEFDHFSLAMKYSGKPKGDSQIFIKILVSSESPPLFQDLFRSFKKVDDYSDKYETKWTAVSFADLEHFITIKSRALVILSDMFEKLKEAEKEASTRINAIDDFYLTPLMILMEHKRNTSTQAQLSRYLMHSALAIFSDKSALMEELFDLPIRSWVGMWISMNQWRWYYKMHENTMYMSKFLDSIREGITDRLFLPSFYSDNLVDFNSTMGEIYYCNLMNPTHGMRSHREKAIMIKMMKIEKKYREMIQSGESILRSFEDCCKKKSTFCTFNMDFVTKSFEFFKGKAEYKSILAKSVDKSLSVGIEHIVKMTRATSGVKADFSFMNKTDRSERSVVFEECVKVLENFGVSTLREIVVEYGKMCSLFSTFAKAQIGGSREILVQSILTRIFTAMFNAFWEEICKFEPKEMVTGERKKKEIQSKTVLDMNQEMLEINKGMTHRGVTFSINSDASKWAPSMVMQTYMEFFHVIKMDIPKSYHDFCMSVLSAYSNKILFAPNTFVQKMDKASQEQIEDDEVLKLSKEFMEENGMCLFHSGMGQGNFQHGSSALHCMYDNYSDHLINEVMKGMCELKTETLISSDDSTKMVLMTVPFTKNKSSNLQKYALHYYDLYVSLRKCANIHTNLKKSALINIVTEFNSIFNIMKRVYHATLKDCYNSVNVVDMTRPAGAVKEAIANCRRLLDNGCYKNTVQLAMDQNREKLMLWYDYDEETVATMKDVLKCKDSELPFNLGFLPNTFIFETIKYGPEFHIHLSTSKELDNFYEKVYSRNEFSVRDPDEETRPDDISLLEKMSITLSSRVDKQLQTLKDKTRNTIFEELDLYDGVMVCHRMSPIFYDKMKYVKSYILNTKSNYGFSQSFRMHSMVRGLQLKRHCRLAGQKVSSSITEVLNTIVNLDNYTTHIKMFDHYKQLVSESKEIQEKLKTYRKTRDLERHPKFRELTFYKKTQYEDFNTMEFIDCILGTSDHLKGKMMRSLFNMCDYLEIDYEGMMSNPMTTLIKKFGEEGLLIFTNFVEYYHTSNQVERHSMLMDFPTSYNRKTDMELMYCYKTNPDYILTRLESDSVGNFIKDMHTNMAFVNNSEMWVITDKEACMSDNREEMVLKSFISGEMSNDGSIVYSSPTDLRYLKTYPRMSKEIEMKHKDYKKFKILSDKYMIEMIYSIQERKMSVVLYGEKSNYVKAHILKEASLKFVTNYTLILPVENDDKTNEVYSADVLKSNLWFERIEAKNMPKISMMLERNATTWNLSYSACSENFSAFRAEYKYDSESKMPIVQEINKMRLKVNDFKDISELMNKLGFNQTLFNTLNTKESHTSPDSNLDTMKLLQSSLMSFMMDEEFLFSSDDEEADETRKEIVENLFMGGLEDYSFLSDDTLMLEMNTHYKPEHLMREAQVSSTLCKELSMMVRATCREKLSLSKAALIETYNENSEMFTATFLSEIKYMLSKDCKSDFQDPIVLMIYGTCLRSTVFSMDWMFDSNLKIIERERFSKISDGWTRLTTHDALKRRSKFFDLLLGGN